MGRKSSKKRNRLEARALKDQEEKRIKKVANSLVPGMFLFIWGSFLFGKTFISFRTLIIMALIGVVVGITVLYFLWRHKKYGLLAALFVGSFWGGSLPYSFIATTNYYLRDNPENVLLNILETGNGSGLRRKCKTPYAVIEYENIQKSIVFDCHFEKTISNYKRVRLKVSKGFWGYTVYIDKNIND